jgi:hypothetical protein
VNQIGIKLSKTSLERAIELIKQGRLIEAQKLLKSLIAADHHNLSAWFWFVETCSTNKQRINVLEICLEYNPESEQVKHALNRLRSLPVQKIHEEKKISSGKNLDLILLMLPNLFNKSFEKTLYGLILFLTTYILAMFITLVVISIHTHPLAAYYLVVFAPISIFYFPTGLISFLTQQFDYIPQEMRLTFIAVLSYLSISLIASIIKNKWVFRFLYVVFIILLIMNIAGCSISAPIRLSNIN